MGSNQSTTDHPGYLETIEARVRSKMYRSRGIFFLEIMLMIPAIWWVVNIPSITSIMTLGLISVFIYTTSWQSYMKDGMTLSSVLDDHRCIRLFVARQEAYEKAEDDQFGIKLFLRGCAAMEDGDLDGAKKLFAASCNKGPSSK